MRGGAYHHRCRRQYCSIIQQKTKREGGEGDSSSYLLHLSSRQQKNRTYHATRTCTLIHHHYSMSYDYGSVANARKGPGNEESSSSSAAPTDESTRLIQDVQASTPEEPTPLLNQETSGFWSKLFFGWISVLLHRGNGKKRLDDDDLKEFPLPESCTTDVLSQGFEKAWEEELKKSSPSLARALFQAFGFDFVVGGFCLKLIHDSALFVGPQVLNGIMHFLQDENAPLSRGLWLTFAVTISQVVMSLCLRHYFFKCYKFGLRIRTAVVVAVYKKALVLSAGERYTRSLGEITNLMSIDAERLQELTTYLHAVWYSFYQIALALYFLWQQLGPSCLGGVLVIFVMMPVTKRVARWMGSLQKRLMTAKDQRVELNSEVLGAMKIIKLQAWEGPFLERITKLREEELLRLRDYIIANCLSIMLWSAVPLSVALAVFATYVLAGHDLEVSRALTALALFDLLRFPLNMLPGIINRMVEAGISLARVRSFLLCEDHKSIERGELAGIGIKMTNMSSAYESKKPHLEERNPNPLAKELLEKNWELSLLKSQLEEATVKIHELETSERNSEGEGTESQVNVTGSLLCLKRINLEVKPGELIAVVGSVGCGKSSLLNAILGEVKELSGRTEVQGKLAFFSQTPFVLNATLKANILFSHVDEHVDEKKYQRALECCALNPDIAALPAGDQTEIGEKGITLSGGQKARLALARAVYHSPDISLIDDALSAVDAHVAKHLFEECIVKELMGGANGKQAVLLATNALQHLSHPGVSRIVVVHDGRIVELGTYSELSKDKTSMFSRFLAVLDKTGVSSHDIPDMDEHEGKGPEEEQRKALDKESPEDKESFKPKGESQGSRLMTVEERSQGHVSFSVYLSWATAAGGAWLPAALVVLYGAVECIQVASKWWLTYWSEHATVDTQIFFLSIYAAINLVSIVAIFLRLLFLMLCGLRASRQLFNELLQVILHAPMSFFDTTPIGRIVNRFSKDIYTVDEQLMMALRSYLSTVMAVFSTIVVVSVVTPVFTLCLIPIIIYYGYQQSFFTMTYRELKRLDSVNRSPIYALLGETIDGVATIRAYSAEKSLIRRLTAMVDLQQNAYYLLCVAQCWLAVRLELVGTVIISLACICCVVQHPFRGGDATFAGLAGLSISFALSVTQSLNWSVRMASDLEAGMVAVERVRQYCKVETEAAHWTPEDAKLSPSWPSGGRISFQGTKLRYRPGLPLVLKGLDIEIPERAKVGVVGRTGAGKSTLMLALMRVVELDSGKILIDGVDIRTLGLTKVRSKIAVIPQDPVLFSGTIRNNLDPFNEYSDETLVDCLTRVGLLASTSASSSSLSSLSLSGGVQSLNDSVKEGGGNFSVGERQLLVIARALLCGAAIVIMDEATAAVDADTDARIQKVMRSEFAGATCITVAHRLNTIMDCDLVLVMGDGRAEEFDTPKALLSKGGMFRDLVRAASSQDFY